MCGLNSVFTKLWQNLSILDLTHTLMKEILKCINASENQEDDVRDDAIKKLEETIDQVLKIINERESLFERNRVGLSEIQNLNTKLHALKLNK